MPLSHSVSHLSCVSPSAVQAIKSTALPMTILAFPLSRILNSSPTAFIKKGRKY